MIFPVVRLNVVIFFVRLLVVGGGGVFGNACTVPRKSLEAECIANRKRFGWPRTGARSGAEASAVIEVLSRAPEWAVSGQDPNTAFDLGYAGALG